MGHSATPHRLPVVFPPDHITKVSIHYNEKQNAMYGNELGLNLEDLVWSLDKNLRRRHNAKAAGKFSPGKVVLHIEGTTPDTVKPYLEAFHTAMRRRRFYILIQYDLA